MIHMLQQACLTLALFGTSWTVWHGYAAARSLIQPLLPAKIVILFAVDFTKVKCI